MCRSASACHHGDVTEAQKTVAMAALGFTVTFFAAFYLLSREVEDSLLSAGFGGGIFLVLGLLVVTRSSGDSQLSLRRLLLFLGGLVAGYVLTGIVLGPGVLAVLLGVVAGLAAAALLGK